MARVKVTISISLACLYCEEKLTQKGKDIDLKAIREAFEEEHRDCDPQGKLPADH
mgnify:CR=1 FL=1|jgi:hypothetical protein